MQATEIRLKQRLTKTLLHARDKTARYFFLAIISFVFVYPLIHMALYAFMTAEDVVDPFVNILPTKAFYFANFISAFKVLDFVTSLLGSVSIAVPAAILQCVSVSVIAYGLARFDVPFKKAIFGLILIGYVVPTQATVIPQMLTFSALKIDNALAFMLSAALGQGLRSAIFILIFYRFYTDIPQSLIEAAKLDGAGSVKIFVSIAVPLSLSAYLLTFLFSVVWYYNETTLTSLFLSSDYKTLPLSLKTFLNSFNDQMGGGTSVGKTVNEAIYMAGTFLSVLPLLITYFVLQKRFVQSIDKAGITGE